MPYFFAGLENLEYPKERIRLFFVTEDTATDADMDEGVLDQTLQYINAWKTDWEVNFDAQTVCNDRQPIGTLRWHRR